MRLSVTPGRRVFLVATLVMLAGSQVQSCSSDSESNAGPTSSAGLGTGGGGPTAGDAAIGGTGSQMAGGSGVLLTGGSAGEVSIGTGGDQTGAAAGHAGSPEPGGRAGGEGVAGAQGAHEVVAIVQSETADRDDITLDDIRSLVAEAVSLAGGLDFITDNMTVVLKPNLVSTTTGRQQLATEANGVTTDRRITLAVAELVRARDPNGQILIMEGSAVGTVTAFDRLGYTTDYFGNTVDQLIAFEGESCRNPSTDGLVQRTAVGGEVYWINETYLNADVVISLPVVKTHWNAGVTGAVKNLALGATPLAYYGSPNVCDRTQTINHEREPLDDFIHDYYSLRPADFVVMDGLCGMGHGPEPSWAPGGDYETDRKNMRLVLAARNAVAIDTIETLIMDCYPDAIGYLQALDASGFGPADPDLIDVVGKQVAEVKEPVYGLEWACSLHDEEPEEPPPPETP